MEQFVEHKKVLDVRFRRFDLEEAQPTNFLSLAPPSWLAFNNETTSHLLVQSIFLQVFLARN